MFFFYDGIIHKKTNATFIRLIPKKNNALKVSDFKPTSLVINKFMIIVKALFLRLREVYEFIISNEQLALVKDRQILDAFLVANDVVEEYTRNNREALAFKIGFENAYDYVNWNFLNFMLKDRGFGDIW